MGKKQFVMDLAKLIIFAAWADGILSNDEINAKRSVMDKI